MAPLTILIWVEVLLPTILKPARLGNIGWGRLVRSVVTVTVKVRVSSVERVVRST